MAKHDPTQDASLDHADSTPKPSDSAATAVGAVGPGALAAAETPTDAGELTSDEMATLRSVVRRVGGVEALIRWLHLHPELK